MSHNGLNENALHTRKNLRLKDKILDYMGSEELGANIFRATQTEAKLQRERLKGKEQVNETHYQVGRIVRHAIEQAGGTMPEDLPTPQKSIQQLERDEQRRIKQQQRPLLFPELESSNEDPKE